MLWCVAVFWYFWRFLDDQCISAKDLFKQMLQAESIDIPKDPKEKGLTAERVKAFLTQRQIPHTAAGLRYFVHGIGLTQPGKGAVMRQIGFREFYDHFQKNKPVAVAS